MEGEKFTNTSMSIKALLGLIEANDIAIPEIQRPFVWKNAQVRDLMDSLYKGFPTGYIILWKNPNVKLKDGTISAGKKVVIDGQQRFTVMMLMGIALSTYYSPWKSFITHNGKPRLSFSARPEDQEYLSFLITSDHDESAPYENKKMKHFR